jgi:hypothetical protein
MSEQDKFEAQGRAYAALKTATSNAATLTVSLREYSKRLKDLSRAIDTLLHDPAQRDPPGTIKSYYESVMDELRQLETDRAILQIKELHEETSKALLLHEQIEKF